MDLHPAKRETQRKRPVLREVAHHRFMQHLYSGAIKPGQLVSQRELCEELVVPLGPMREALKRLEAENIVSLIPQRGIKIVDIDETVIDDVYQLRKIIETEAVRRFTQVASPEDVRNLLDRTREARQSEQVSSSLDVEEIIGLTDIDHAMHYAFLEALDNRFAHEIMQRMLGQLRLLRFVNRLRRYVNPTALAEHTDILTIVARGDADGAARAMVAHLDASWRRAKGMD